MLLEYLPEFGSPDWPAYAPKILDQSRLKLPQDLRQHALSEAITILSDPQFSDLFAPDALAEVSITAPLDGEHIHGTIDRLIVTDRVVTAVDFKTNRAAPDSPNQTPVGLLRQLGAYAHALGQIYPDKTIRTEILWTSSPKRMQYPEDLIEAALRNRDAP